MNIKSLILAVAILGLSAGVVLACGHMGSKCGCDMSSHKKEAASTLNTQLPNVGNTICPVTGNKIGAMGEPVKYEYKGKIYNLCCGMCIKDFKNDPEKYSKIAEEQAKAK